MSKTTQATISLTKAGVNFSLHPYDYDPDAQHIGLQAAHALGLDPSATFKTLMALVDTKAVCVVVPSDAEVSMKKLAAHFAGKSAKMMTVSDAERLSAYKVGGISPFGQKKPVPYAIDESAQIYDLIYINAGLRGLLLSIKPADAARILAADFSDLMA